MFNNLNYSAAVNYLEGSTNKNQYSMLMLADCYTKLKRHNDAVDIITKNDLINSDEIKVRALDLLASAYSGQNMIPEYTTTIESLKEVQKTVHRFTQTSFAYGRNNDIEKLSNLLYESLTVEHFTQKDYVRFLSSGISGLKRSFYYRSAIDLYEKFTKLIEPSDRLKVDIAMLYEIENNYTLALKLYKDLIEGDSLFSWWASFRIASIYHKNKKYKKSFQILENLFPISDTNKNSIKIIKRLPQVKSIYDSINELDSVTSNRYRVAARNILSSLPGWDISIWNSGDDIVFFDLYKSIVSILANEAGNAPEKYLKASYHYGKLLSDRRLWTSASDHMKTTLKSYDSMNLTAPEECYQIAIRSLTNSNRLTEAIQLSDEAEQIRPNSICIDIERAILFQRNTNLFRSKAAWAKVMLKNKPNELSVWNYTAAAEVNLISLDLKKHENIVSKAVDVYGEDNPTLIYYMFNSYCTKLINFVTEKNITGNGPYSEFYSIDSLISKFNYLSDKVSTYSLDEEMSHRIKHRYIQVKSATISFTGERADSVDFIDNILEFLGFSQKDKLIQSIRTLLINRSSGENYKKEVERIIKASPQGKYSYTEWLLIHQVLIVNKFIRLAYLAREKSISEAINLSEAGYRSTHYALQRCFHAHLEKSNITEAGKVLNYINKVYPQQSINTQLELIMCLFSGDKLEYPLPNTDQLDIYHKIITGKKVAIVGPAPISEEVGKEIDSHDSVVRFNYRGPIDQEEGLYTGAKVDIAYQNGPNVRAYFKDEIPDYMDDVAVYNVEYITNSALANENECGKARNGGTRIKLYSGVMMAVPAALFDIVRYKPEKISLYGTNFYLSSNPYSKSYTTHKGLNRYAKQNIDRLLELVGAHDLIAQKRFVKNLSRNNAIKLDSKGDEVINMSDEEYMSELEKLYTY